MQKHVLYTAVCLIYIAGCGKVNTASLHPDGNRIYVIGHGGSGFSDLAGFPPNSWPSATRAIEHYNADGAEIDIQMSRDHVLFMYHDQILENASFCSGCVYTYHAQALRQCRFRPQQGKQAREMLTTVEELIRRFAQRKIKPILFLDLKNPMDCLDSSQATDYYIAILQEAHLMIGQYAAYDWVILQSANRKWLTYARTRFPEMKLMLDYIKDTDDIDFAAAGGLYGVAAPSDDLSAEEILYAHSKGLKVQLYGARLQGDMVTALNKSPDYFLTDNIPLTQQIIR